jgi:nitrate reductase delta subunit
MACCSTARARWRCISSNMSTVKAAIGVRRWSTSRRSTRRRVHRHAAKELPDFVPLFLEYAVDTRGQEAARDLLAQPAHVITALAERLAKRKSPYEAIFRALLTLAKAKPDKAALEALLAEPDPEPDDLEALDAAWEEEEVRFGPGNASDCGKDGLGAKLRQATRPAPGLEPLPAAGPRTTIHHSGSRH